MFASNECTFHLAAFVVTFPYQVQDALLSKYGALCRVSPPERSSAFFALMPVKCILHMFTNQMYFAFGCLRGFLAIPSSGRLVGQVWGAMQTLATRAELGFFCAPCRPAAILHTFPS